MTGICCLVFARLASTRVPNKLLQEVGGRTLLDRGLDYLVKLREACPNVTPWVCTPDEEISQAAFRREIDSLSDVSKDATSWPELIAPLVPMLRERFDWVWDANIFCHPFLRVETGQVIVKQIECSTGPFVATIARPELVWDYVGEPVIGAGQLANTKTNPIAHRPAHIAYCWPASCLFSRERVLAYDAKPVALSFHWSELIDIDTPEDLEHARAVAGGVKLQKRIDELEEQIGWLQHDRA